MDISLSKVYIIKKLGKYKEPNPFYYYYNIETNIYRYIGKNKNRRNIMDFRCSDTNFLAKGYYYI